MKNFFIGLIIGLVVCGVIGFIALPGIKQTAYDSGMAAGVQKGMADGKAAGITQGIAQLKAEQQQKRVTDSTAAAKRYLDAKRKAAAAAAARAKKEVVKPVQNWHVIDGKIDEPITN